MNIPNAITLLRLVLIPFFVDLMIYGYYGPALAVFLVACISDAADGLIARLTNTQTELGAFLDPMADKLLVVASFVTLAAIGQIPVWLAIIVVSRDIILSLGAFMLYLMGHKLEIRPSIIGKATTVIQLAVTSLVLIMMNYGGSWILLHAVQWTAAVLTVASGVHYVIQGMKMAA